MLQDAYIPTGTSETFTFNINQSGHTTLGDSYHQYGFSNQLDVPEPSAIAALMGGAGMLLGLRRRRA